MTTADRNIAAALAVLIVLQVIMLSALYAGVRPHPPAQTPIFGMAPFLGGAISAAVAALILGPLQGFAGRSLSGIAALAALVSYGPHKYLDPQFGLIWPGVIAGQFAAVVVIVHVLRKQSRGVPAGA